MSNDSSFRARTWLVTGGAAALLAGLAGSWLRHGHGAHAVVPTHEPRTTSSAAPHPRPVVSESSGLFLASLARINAEVASLDERIAKVEDSGNQTGERTSTPSDDSPQHREDVQEELRRRVVDELHERIAAHEKTAVDAAWAAETTPQITRLLGEARQALGHADVAVNGVDCRTDSCVATLRFASYEAATLGASAFVTRASQTPCATTALLPQEQVAGPVDVPLLFLDCRTPNP